MRDFQKAANFVGCDALQSGEDGRVVDAGDTLQLAFHDQLPRQPLDVAREVDLSFDEDPGGDAVQSTGFVKRQPDAVVADGPPEGDVVGGRLAYRVDVCRRFAGEDVDPGGRDAAIP